MSRKASKDQEKIMSWLFRGKGIFNPLNTGRIDEFVCCIREYVANIFFYKKNGLTIMIDAGYNYDALQEKMSWLNIKPEEINNILITHQDTDHIGAIEKDSNLLFKNAMIYIGESENQYLTGEKRRKVFYGLYKLPPIQCDNPRVLLKDEEIFYIGDIKIQCFLVPGHTLGHMVYLIDDKYLFTGDTIWLGKDGGYSFLNILAEDNNLAKRSLEKLKNKLKNRYNNIFIITGHTGWTDNLDFAFAHTDKVCNAMIRQRPKDDSVPYDAYDESDDTEENSKNKLIKIGT